MIMMKPDTMRPEQRLTVHSINQDAQLGCTANLYREESVMKTGFPCEVFFTRKNLFSLQGGFAVWWKMWKASVLEKLK